jgi:hypothetical protein
MKPDLTDEQTETLVTELDRIIENDRYPFSPRIRILKEIRRTIQTVSRSGTGAAPEALRAAKSDYR